MRFICHNVAVAATRFVDTFGKFQRFFGEELVLRQFLRRADCHNLGEKRSRCILGFAIGIDSFERQLLAVVRILPADDADRRELQRFMSNRQIVTDV